MLTLFQAWCAWSSMQVRIDKCVSFGMMKRDNTYSQILPVLSIGAGQIPAVGLNEEFKYLGRSYSYDMHNSAPKLALEDKLSRLLSITNSLKNQGSN